MTSNDDIKTTCDQRRILRALIRYHRSGLSYSQMAARLLMDWNCFCWQVRVLRRKAGTDNLAEWWMRATGEKEQAIRAMINRPRPPKRNARLGEPCDNIIEEEASDEV